MGQDGSYAAFYGSRGCDTHDFYTRKDRVEELLESHMHPDQRVLDVGCGTGPMVDFFCSRDLRYYGLDVATGMLDSITEQFRSKPYFSRIELKVGSAEKVPYPDAYFDHYVGMGLLEYLIDMQPTFREIARVVKPGGLAVLTIPNLVSVNRFIMRNTGFITALNHYLKRLAGAQVPPRQEFVHMELSPRGLDSQMERVGFERAGKAFYDYKLVFYPFNRLLPNFAYAVNRRVENRSPYFLANGYIGLYRRQGERLSPAS
jgi:ubiquinone/menaquinone biosynthesis C-methylase UbiE